MNNVLTLSSTLSMIRPLKLGFSLKIFWLINLLLTFSLLVFYILQVNSLTNETYLIKNYERKLTQISQENETLNIDFSKFYSLANVENYLLNQNFEKAKQTKYIQILENTVVTK